MICWEKVICSGQPSMSRCTISPLSAKSLTRDYSKRLGGPSWPLVRTDRRLQYGESICVMYPVSPCVPPVYKSQLVHGSLTKDSCTSPSSCMDLWRKIHAQHWFLLKQASCDTHRFCKILFYLGIEPMTTSFKLHQFCALSSCPEIAYLIWVKPLRSLGRYVRTPVRSEVNL